MSSLAKIVEIHTPPGTIGYIYEHGSDFRIPFYDKQLPKSGLKLGDKVTFDVYQSPGYMPPFATKLKRIKHDQ